MAARSTIVLFIVCTIFGAHAQQLETNSSNAYAPVISTIAIVQENVPVGSIIARFSVSDADEGDAGRVACSLRSTPLLDLQGLGNGTYAIHTAGYLDYEVSNHHSVIVNCIDSGMEPRISDLNIDIEVIDVNDNSPSITVQTSEGGESFAEISEDALPGYFVAHVTANDLDSGVNGEVECTVEDSNFQLITLYSTEYKVNTIQRLDRELQDTYFLKIKCRDHGVPQRVTVEYLEIRVSDVNDNVPIITSELDTVTIMENSVANTLLTRIFVTDKDAGQNRAVDCSLDNISEELFKLERSTSVEGEYSLLTKAMLDREQIISHFIQVECSDLGEVSLQWWITINVLVTDVNDNPPIFALSSYRATISKSSTIWTEVLRLTAVDYDYGQNSIVTYSLDNPVDAFQIEDNTGIIRTVASLENNNASQVILTVTARDQGVPPLSATTIVTIDII